MIFSRAKLLLTTSILTTMILTSMIPTSMIVTALAALLVACGDPKYQPAAIAVSFSSTPPTSMYTDSTIGITAVVANDAKNAGVDFTCAPAGDCGLFNPTHIGSTIPTCYQAPGQVPAGDTITITATSVTDPTKSITSAPITIQLGTPAQPCAP